MNAEEIIKKLMDGNGRFVRGEMKKYDFPARRKELLAGQHPLITVVACSDSRVAPEYIFDVNLGEIFKIETAGNVLDSVALGSVEYGVEHLHTPVLMILGHTMCGAVTACCKAAPGEKPHGNLGEILKRIEPAAVKRKRDVGASIEENLFCVKECMLANSSILKKMHEEKKVRIVLAKYLLETGEVKILG